MDLLVLVNGTKQYNRTLLNSCGAASLLVKAGMLQSLGGQQVLEHSFCS